MTTGAAGWFSSCTGSDYGACGTCRKTDYQCAWQNLAGTQVAIAAARAKNPAVTAYKWAQPGLIAPVRRPK